MNERPATETDADGWRKRYEELRARVTGGTPATIAEDTLGLAVLVRKGMAAWVRAWQEPPACCGVVDEATSQGLRIDPGADWRREAASLLASMTLSHLRQPNS